MSPNRASFPQMITLLNSFRHDNSHSLLWLCRRMAGLSLKARLFVRAANFCSPFFLGPLILKTSRHFRPSSDIGRYLSLATMSALPTFGLCETDDCSESFSRPSVCFLALALLAHIHELSIKKNGKSCVGIEDRSKSSPQCEMLESKGICFAFEHPDQRRDR